MNSFISDNNTFSLLTMLLIPLFIGFIALRLEQRSQQKQFNKVLKIDIERLIKK